MSMRHITEDYFQINQMIKDGNIADFSTWLQFFRALKTTSAMRESMDILWRDCEIDCYKLNPIMASVLQHVETYHALVWICTICSFNDPFVSVC